MSFGSDIWVVAASSVSDNRHKLPTRSSYSSLPGWVESGGVVCGCEVVAVVLGPVWGRGLPCCTWVGMVMWAWSTNTTVSGTTTIFLSRCLFTSTISAAADETHETHRIPSRASLSLLRCNCEVISRQTPAGIGNGNASPCWLLLHHFFVVVLLVVLRGDLGVPHRMAICPY